MQGDTPWRALGSKLTKQTGDQDRKGLIILFWLLHKSPPLKRFDHLILRNFGFNFSTKKVLDQKNKPEPVQPTRVY